MYRYFFLCLLAYLCPFQAAAVEQLSQGQFKIESSELGLAPVFSTWQAITLPDNWNKSRPDVGGVGVYRFDWVLKEQSKHLYALLLPRVSNNAEIYFNGKLIGKHGRFKGDSLVWNTPYYVVIPNDLLHLGHNSIVIKVSVKANYFGRLLPLQVGGDEAIKASYQRLLFIQVTLSQICAVFAFTVGVGLFFVWWYRREPQYGWFALGSVSWVLYALYFFITDIPFALDYWVRVCFIFGFIMPSAMLIFICQFMGWKHKRRDYYIMGYALVASFLLICLPDKQVFHAIQWIMAAYALLYCILTVFLFKALSVEKYKKNALIALSCIAINALLGLHDWLNIFFVLNQPYLLQYGEPLIFIVMGHQMLKQYVLALKEVERGNEALDQRLKEREKALKLSLENTRQIEHEKVRLQERERMMCDIHDGVGGHLVSALTMSEALASKESKLISEILKEAMDELRIVIDSLDPDEQCLPQMLASFRYRYQQRLQAHGIEVTWDFDQLDQLDQLERFGAGKSLQLLRILQELMTNIIKHAEADKVCVRVYACEQGDGEKIYGLSVTDNGKGFDVAGTIGRGLGNLKRRAAAVGGLVEFTSQSSGTTVEVLFPEGE